MENFPKIDILPTPREVVERVGHIISDIYHKTDWMRHTLASHGDNFTDYVHPLDTPIAPVTSLPDQQLFSTDPYESVGSYYFKRT